MCKRMVAVLAAAGLVGSLSTTAYAGPYIGASWGAYEVNESGLDDNDDLWKAYAGFQANDIFGVEASWVDFSRAGTGTSSFEGDGWGLSAVLSVPIGITSSLFVKAGQFWWDSESRLGGIARGRDGDDPFFGAGVKFGAGLALRLEWERYDIANIDLDTYSIGLQLGF